MCTCRTASNDLLTSFTLHWELRRVNATANMYLALAVMLNAGLEAAEIVQYGTLGV